MQGLRSDEPDLKIANQRIVEGLQEVLDSGAEMLMLNPVFDHMEHLEALHERIVPRLRKP